MSGKTKAKVVLVGDSRSGKSCLLAAFADETFDATYSPTVGVEFKARTVRIDDGDGRSGTVKLTLWDSAGATSLASSCRRPLDSQSHMVFACRTGEGQNYQAIQSTYYKGARCAVIVFDVTSRTSFQNIERWMSEVAKYAEGPIPVVLVATKIDLWEERVVTAQDAEEWAAEQAYAFRNSPSVGRVAPASLSLTLECSFASQGGHPCTRSFIKRWQQH